MDQVIRLESRYGMGYMKPDPVFRFSENPRTLGFLGATGSFADPEKRVGYA